MYTGSCLASSADSNTSCSKEFKRTQWFHVDTFHVSMDEMDNQQQTQSNQGASAKHSQISRKAATQNNTQNIAPQLQRRPSVHLHASEVDIPQHSPMPMPAHANDPNQLCNQSNDQQMSVEPPQNLHQQQQHQNHNQQYIAFSNPQSMQHQQALHAHQQNHQSQSNSLNPSPVSQPAVINQPMSHQQHVLQPLLNYQPSQQIQQPGIYKPVTIVPTPLLFANAAPVPAGQTVINPATQTTSSVTMNAEPSVIAAPPGSPTEVVKRGRFRVTKGGKSSSNLNETVSPNDVSSRKELADNAPSEHASTGIEVATAQSDASMTKKKGRFVVKSGAGGNQTTKPSVTSGGEGSDKVTENPTTSEKSDACDGKSGGVPAEVLAVVGENQNVAPPAKLTVGDAAVSKLNDTNSVPKKKGRFVVKKGPTTVRSSSPPPSHDASSLDGSTSKQSIPTVVSTLTNGFQDPSVVLINQKTNTTAPLYQMQQPQVFVQPVSNTVAANSVPFTNIQNSQAVGAYDLNGNFVLVSTPIITTQNFPPQPINPQPSPSSANITTQHQQSTSHQPPPAPDALAPTPKKHQVKPKAPRQTETAAHRHSIGGRLFGTTGVGKVLHHLESVRLEVIEADKSIATLQSENKLLKDKNKELEAKNAKLERQLAEERAKNKKLSKSLSLNPPESNLNTQVNKKDISTPNPAAPLASRNKSLVVENSASQTKSSDSSVNSSPPKVAKPLQNQVEVTPTKQSKHYVEDSMKPLDVSKGNEVSKITNSNDASSLPSSPRPSMFQEASSVSTASDIAGSLYELPSVETTPQQFAIVEGFDQQLPTVPVVATGTVVVPVVVPKEAKRFDPLGTPKRSGSKIMNVGELSELNGVQQLSAFSVPQINVPDGTLPSTVPIQPNNVAAAPILSHPPLIQHQQHVSLTQPSTLPMTQHQSSHNMPVNQLQHPDPFDEIALRHGCIQ